MAKHVHRRRRLAAQSELPALADGQRVMEVVAVRGQGLFVLRDATGAEALYEMPARLRGAALLKPGAYVFARPDATRAGGKVRGDIEVAVLDHQLAAVRKAAYWPPAFGARARAPVPYEGVLALPESGDEDALPPGGNPNRAHWSMYHDESSSESESSEGEVKAQQAT